MGVVGGLAGVVWIGVMVGAACAQVGPSPQSPMALVKAMVAHEDDTAAHKDCYEFVSEERSDRTGGHLWKERVVEIPQGRVRLLLAVDGKPLSVEEEKEQRGKLQWIQTDPAPFLRKEELQKNDEAQARKMLDLLPQGFLFDNVRLADGVWRMDFHPNPDFSPSGVQERVLHGMSGWVAIDAKDLRLMHIEGQLPVDVTIGFGLLATIKAGSRFESDRKEEGGHWRTVHVLTDIRGKAALFKSVSKDSEISRSEFVYLQPGVGLDQAVTLLEM
jgi:hypothetical protein